MTKFDMKTVEKHFYVRPRIKSVQEYSEIALLASSSEGGGFDDGDSFPA